MSTFRDYQTQAMHLINESVKAREERARKDAIAIYQATFWNKVYVKGDWRDDLLAPEKVVVKNIVDWAAEGRRNTKALSDSIAFHRSKFEQHAADAMRYTFSGVEDKIRRSLNETINRRIEEIMGMATKPMKPQVVKATMEGQAATITQMQTRINALEARITNLTEDRDNANGALTNTIKVNEKLEKERDSLRSDNVQLRLDLQRALGYIDRVNEDSEPLAVETTVEKQPLRRGPQLMGVSLGSNYAGQDCSGSLYQDTRRRY